MYAAAGPEEEERPTFLFDGLFLGATAVRVLVVIDTVAEIAAPRPNWRAARLCRLRSSGFKLGEVEISLLNGTGLELEMEEPVPSWDALSSPVNALKRCRKDGTGHEKE